MKRMRIRLAKKILKHPRRYSWGKRKVAMLRLGWKVKTWTTGVFVPLPASNIAIFEGVTLEKP